MSGVLRGYDQLVNLVLDDAVESAWRGRVAESCVELTRRDEMQGFGETDKRELGRVVCRGMAVAVVCPKDGFEEIQNPFAQEE